MTRSPLMLLDTASLYFRAFYGVPDRSGPDEPPRNAVTGLVDMIATLVEMHRPSGVVACWDDDWRPQFRVAAVPSYKAHRVAEGTDGSGGEDVPPALASQVPVIVDLLTAVGIPRIGHPGYEADDVIGTLAARAVDAGRPVLVVTGDRDLFQLIDDAAGVIVLYTARTGVRDAQRVDEGFLRETYGVENGARYADLALLRGDPSDGLPGVKGIGEKTAARLLAEYGTLEALQAALAEGRAPRGAVGARLLAAGDYLDRARPVVEVARDIPLDGPVDGTVSDVVVDPARLSDLVTTYHLTGVPRLLRALGVSA